MFHLLVTGVMPIPDEMGLVGVARAEMNQFTYQCVFVSISLAGLFVNINAVASDPPAILTVLENGE